MAPISPRVECSSPIRNLYLGAGGSEEGGVAKRKVASHCSLIAGLMAAFLLGGASVGALLYRQFAPDVWEQTRLRTETVRASSREHDVKYCRTLLAKQAIEKAASGGSATFTIEEVRMLERELSKSDSGQQRLKEVEDKLAKSKAESAFLKKDNMRLAHHDAASANDRVVQMLNEEAIGAVNKSARLLKLLGGFSQFLTNHLGCFKEVQIGVPTPLSGLRDHTNGAALGLYASMTVQQCIAICAERAQCKAAVWIPDANASCAFQTENSTEPLREDDEGRLAGAFTFVKTGACFGRSSAQLAARPPAEGARRKRYAYVMMAYDDPEHSQPGDSLFPVLAMARALQHLSRYPLLLLTNTTHFRDGTPVADAMHSLGVEVLPVQKVLPPSGKDFEFRSWNVAWWKLQIWNLTQYDKLIWMDSDAILTRSVDWLFERRGTWAQRDDWFCGLNQPSVCSGIVLLEPNASDAKGLQQCADSGHCDIRKGDQGVIEQYFEHVKERPIHMLSDVDASFGQCMGQAPSPLIDTDGRPFRGAWSTPAFVHKSGGWGNTNNNEYVNVCFSHKIARQYYAIGNSTVNICHYHPLGPYWRNLFCEATAAAGLAEPEANAFCNDDCWYRGVEPDAAGPNATNATSRLWCAPVDVERTKDYRDRVAGEPLRELMLKSPQKMPSMFLK
jgi:hypothetical protein